MQLKTKDSPRKIDLIITDIGGVLLKTDKAIISCIQRLAREKSIPDGSIEDIYSVFGIGIEDYIRAYLPDSYEDRAGECHDAFKKIYPSEVRHLLTPFEGVDATLEYLRSLGIRLAVLSCMRREAVEAVLKRLSFKGFDQTYSIEDYGKDHKRPDPKGLKMLMDVLGGQPERTIYVGDTDSDIHMAKNAEVISVAVRTGAQPNTYLEKTRPDYFIDSFCDIPTEVLQSFV